MNKEELLKDDFAIDTINDIIAERDGYMQQVKALESNWKALKEWLIDSYMLYIPMVADGSQMTKVLNKMNELEGDK